MIVSLLLIAGIGTPEIIIILLFAFVPFSLTIYCLIDIIRSHFKDTGTKFLWILLVMIAPFIGSLVYLLTGRNQRLNRP